MALIPYDPRLPTPPQGDRYLMDLNFQLTMALRELGQRIDLMSFGHLSGTRNTGTAAPTSGTWARGDVVRNSAPSEAGSASSKYVIYGWECVTAGTPGTWREMRMLTGN